MTAEMNEDTRGIKVVFECNGSDELVLDYEERRLEIGLLVEVVAIANRKGVDLSEVTIRFVAQKTA
jgi:hypothetical protein